MPGLPLVARHRSVLQLLRCGPYVWPFRFHKAWINTGSGWQRNDNWRPPVVIAYMSGTNNIDNGVRIIDVTGVNNQPNHCHSHLKYERPYH
jgi:hypothetical protein